MSRIYLSEQDRAILAEWVRLKSRPANLHQTRWVKLKRGSALYITEHELGLLVDSHGYSIIEALVEGRKCLRLHNSARRGPLP